MSRRPPWLPPTRNAPIADEAIEALCAVLEQGGSRWVQGASGSGRTQVLAAVATRSDRPLIAVRLAGCRDADDITLALGWALQSVPFGTIEAVILAAQKLNQPLFLLDDADISALDSVVEQLQAAIPGSSWLCAGSREAPFSLSTDPIALPPRTLPTLPKELDLSATRPGTIHPALLLASLPAGLPRLTTLPSDLLLVDHPQRQIMRPAMIEALRSRLPAPSQIASELIRVYNQTLDLAFGGPVLESHQWEDALTLRWIGEVLADPDQACLASATAARLLVAWGQLNSAERILESAQRRNSRARAPGLAVLAWARADRSLAQGDLEGAQKSYDLASQGLQNSGEDAVLARLHQHRSGSHIQRAQATEGMQYLRTARRLLTVLADSPSISSTLRCAADLAVANGELLSAETLYDQAAGIETPTQETMARRIGSASLSISQGDYRRAQRLLDDHAERHGALVLQGNRFRRLADLALRENRPEQASAFARKALRAYAQGGAHVAVGHIRRLEGDIANSRGEISAAWLHYWNAVNVHLDVHDYAGLVRTVQRIQLLERGAGEEERAVHLMEALTEIEKGMAS